MTANEVRLLELVNLLSDRVDRLEQAVDILERNVTVDERGTTVAELAECSHAETFPANEDGEIVCRHCWDVVGMAG